MEKKIRQILEELSAEIRGLNFSVEIDEGVEYDGIYRFSEYRRIADVERFSLLGIALVFLDKVVHFTGKPIDFFWFLSSMEKYERQRNPAFNVKIKATRSNYRFPIIGMVEENPEPKELEYENFPDIALGVVISHTAFLSEKPEATEITKSKCRYGTLIITTITSGELEFDEEKARKTLERVVRNIKSKLTTK